MAADTPSPQEIERRLEDERAQLRDTVDELWTRMTFEDAWNRIGAYVRDNRADQTLGRLAREKPIAVALTAIGVAWLLFGPSSNPPHRSVSRHRHPDPYDQDSRERLARAEANRRSQTNAAEGRVGSSAVGAGASGDAARGYDRTRGPAGSSAAIASSNSTAASETSLGGSSTPTTPAGGAGTGNDTSANLRTPTTGERAQPRTSASTSSTASSAAAPSGVAGARTTDGEPSSTATSEAPKSDRRPVPHPGSTTPGI